MEVDGSIKECGVIGCASNLAAPVAASHSARSFKETGGDVVDTCGVANEVLFLQEGNGDGYDIHQGAAGSCIGVSGGRSTIATRRIAEVSDRLEVALAFIKENGLDLNHDKRWHDAMLQKGVFSRNVDATGQSLMQTPSGNGVGAKLYGFGSSGSNLSKASWADKVDEEEAVPTGQNLKMEFDQAVDPFFANVSIQRKEERASHSSTRESEMGSDVISHILQPVHGSENKSHVMASLGKATIGSSAFSPSAVIGSTVKHAELVEHKVVQGEQKAASRPGQNVSHTQPSMLTGRIGGDISVDPTAEIILSDQKVNYTPNPSFNGEESIPNEPRHQQGDFNPTVEPSKSPSKWSSLLKPALSARMNLEYFEPILSKEKVKVKPPPVIATYGAAQWESTLVGYFMDGKLPFNVVNNIAKRLWDSKGLVKTLTGANGFYFFKFYSATQCEEILEGGPWHMAGRPIVLKKWQPNMSLNKEHCKTIPIWVNFYNVPLEFWTDKGLSYIASAVGKPLYADNMTTAVQRIQYARICIEVSPESQLPEKFELEVDGGNLVEIAVEYNWVPKICAQCKEFGHTTSKCPKKVRHEWQAKKSKDQEAKQQGEWMEVKKHGKAIAIEPDLQSQKVMKVEEVPGYKGEFSGAIASSSKELEVVTELSITNRFQSLEGNEAAPLLLGGDPSGACKDDQIAAMIPTNLRMKPPAEEIKLNRIQQVDMVGDSEVLETSGGGQSNLTATPDANPLRDKLVAVDEVDQKKQKHKKRKVKNRRQSSTSSSRGSTSSHGK